MQAGSHTFGVSEGGRADWQRHEAREQLLGDSEWFRGQEGGVAWHEAEVSPSGQTEPES